VALFHIALDPYARSDLQRGDPTLALHRAQMEAPDVTDSSA